MTREAPQENWGVNDPGDENLEQASFEGGRLESTIGEVVEAAFPGAIVDIKVDLTHSTRPVTSETMSELGHKLANGEGTTTTIWSDRSTFSVFKPGSEESRE